MHSLCADWANQVDSVGGESCSLFPPLLTSCAETVYIEIRGQKRSADCHTNEFFVVKRTH